MRRPLLPVAVALSLAACGGGGGATTGDGGSDAGGDGGKAETPPGGWNAFDVTATLTITPGAAGGSWSDFPRTHGFTLVWDPVAAQLIAGAGGPVSGSSVTTDDGTAFETLDPISVGVPFATSCGGMGTVTYDELSFTYDGALHGTARGHASYQTGDEVWTATVVATLAGAADATPPRLAAPARTVSPLAPFTFEASEPLPATSLPRLRGTTSGDVVPLAGADEYLDVALGGFASPDVGLRHGELYQLEGTPLPVRDFAGLRLGADAPTLQTTAAPPLAMQDGFESVTTPTFGGAGVLHGGPLTPIAGETSLILNTGFGGGFGFLPYQLGPALAVRLAVAPGATVVRFTTQLVATYDLPQVTFYGDVRVGAPGTAIAHLTNVDATDLVKVTLPRDGDVYLGPLKTLELPLPAGVEGEVTFEIAGVTYGCGLPPPPTALILDDLRVE